MFFNGNNLEKSVPDSDRADINNNSDQFFNFDKNSKDENDENLDLDYNDNELTLCFVYQGNKLGCSFFDKNKQTLSYLNDLPETSVNNFELTNLIIDDLMPTKIITCAKSEINFIEFLKKKCKFTESNDFDNESDFDLNGSDSENENNDNDNLNEENDNNEQENIENKIKFYLTTSNDYNYDLSKEYIFHINTLENMPEFIDVYMIKYNCYKLSIL